MLFHTPVFVHQDSRSIFLVLDFITDVDADKSEFFAEPGTTIPLELAEHLSNINFEFWF